MISEKIIVLDKIKQIPLIKCHSSKFMHIVHLATLIFMNHETSVLINVLKPEQKFKFRQSIKNNMTDKRFRSTQQIPVVISPSTIHMALWTLQGKNSNKINNHNQLLKKLCWWNIKIFLFPCRSHFIPQNYYHKINSLEDTINE